MTGEKKGWGDILPFLLSGIVALLWHLTLKVSGGDDLVYFRTLLDGRSIWEILIHRYQTWSSRLAIELVLIPIVHHVVLWRILDTMIFASIPVLLCRLLDADRGLRWWITGFVLLYPFSDMVSAGWISTTTNYLWPLWCLLFVGLLLKKMVCNKKLRWYEAAAGILASIYGCSQEQVAVIMLLIFLLTVIYLWRRKRYKVPLLYIFCGVDVVSVMVILLCPGNVIRKTQEMEGRMPEFAEFTIWEKFYMGLVNMERIFIANLNHVFLIVTTVLVYLVWRKTKDYKKTLFSGVPVWILLGQSVVRVSHVRFENIFVVPKQSVFWNWTSVETYLPLLFLSACIFGILYALFWLMRENLGTYVYAALLLGCGFASGVVMGFSPTIYASAERPYIYFYFILLFICLMQIRTMQDAVRKEVSLAGRRLAATFLIAFVVINILDVLWVCYVMGRKI